jgi:hypothetical protein
MGGISGLVMAWINELISHDNESTYHPLALLSNVAGLMMSFRAGLRYRVL